MEDQRSTMRISGNIPAEPEGISGKIYRQDREEITGQNEGCDGHDKEAGHDHDYTGTRGKMLSQVSRAHAVITTGDNDCRKGQRYAGASLRGWTAPVHDA